MTKTLTNEKLAVALHAKIAHIITAQRDATPHVVPQRGLLRSRVGDDAFFLLIKQRKEWIAENCESPHMVDELRSADGVEVGRSYRFANFYEAVHFRMRF